MAYHDHRKWKFVVSIFASINIILDIDKNIHALEFEHLKNKLIPKKNTLFDPVMGVVVPVQQGLV